jgi:ribosome-associated translation inhibitor RaiA
MLHNLEFKNFTPSPRLRGLVEELVGRLDRHTPDLSEDAVFLRLFVDENAARRLYHVSIVCDLPRRRRLATQEERHDADEAVRAAFAEIERQLEKHKEMMNHSYLYKRPARREELRREKALIAEEREPELFSTLVERHLQKLYNFVRREIAYHLAIGDLLPGEVTAQEVVDAALLRAYREFAQNPAGHEIKHWLLKLGAERIEAKVRQTKAVRTRDVHIEEDNPETPPVDQSVLTIFGTAANVEVPAVFRNAVIEKYKKLEEPVAV